MSYSVGDRFWIPDEENAWLVGILKEFKSGVLEFQTEKAGIKKFRINDLKHKLEPCGSHVDDHVENLVDLDELSEGAILHHVRNRFSKKIIYTHVGSILVAVNPFENLPIYEERDIRRAFESTALYPHVFVTASVAYQQLKSNRKNQSILISGESGAGKTETTKKVLTFLAQVAPDSKPKAAGEPGMETKILQSNPLLEALGNAKTLRNNNSSRFGKWMKVGFNAHFLIQGCEIINYLLEKSRVVSQSLEERNYHIFYQLIAGADAAMRQRLYLKPAEEYHYLNQSECFHIPGVDDREEFNDVLEAMKTLQFSNSTIESMFKIIAGILLLGNITFEPLPTNTDAAIVAASSREILEQCAELLGIDLDIFLFALQEKKVQMGRGSIVTMKYNAAQAIDNRDTLAKSLYANMFDWTIQRVNSTLKTEESNFSIGILDIFGFEVFQLNSFEQLCINYANEKLQFHFNEVIFHEEKMMYQEEGISLEDIAFEDNSECVNLIEGKPYGLISLLEEECSLGNGTDLSYASKIEKTFVSNKSTSNKFFQKNKTKPDCFSVVHFAGPVEYNVNNFLDKNRDTLNTTVKDAMILSKIPLIADLFTDKDHDGGSSGAAPPAARGGKSDKKQTKSTLGGQFRNQLIGLITNLRLTEPHFIRCIKPNHQKVGGVLDGVLALRQLKYAGLFEAIRIRKSGFAYRANFLQFANSYQLLVDGLMTKRNQRLVNDRDACEIILQTLTKNGQLSPSLWRVGTTAKVFLKNNSDRLVLEKEKTNRILVYVIKLQRFIKRFLTRLFYQKELMILKREKLKLVEQQKKQLIAVIAIQKHWRRKLVQKNMKSMQYLIELRKIIKRREIYKIKDILVKIDEEMKVLRQREELLLQMQQKKDSHAAFLQATASVAGKTTTSSKSNNQPTPMEMRQILASAKKINKTKMDPIAAASLAPNTQASLASNAQRNPISTILSIFEHEIKIAKIMYKLFTIQETLIHDLTLAIQKNNILQLNSLIVKSERLEMNNHPMVIEAKEVIVSLYHKRKIIQQLMKFLLHHQQEFNEAEIESYLAEARQLNINPEFVNKIQLIYENAGPRLKTRNRLRLNIEMVNRYGIEQSVLEVLQIRTHHEAFAESELRAARGLLQMLDFDALLFPPTTTTTVTATTSGASTNIPFSTTEEAKEGGSSTETKPTTLLWGKPILSEPSGPLLSVEIIEICNAITESTLPAIIKMHKQRLQVIAGSVDRVYQIIRYYKWMKVFATWKYPEVLQASQQNPQSSNNGSQRTATTDPFYEKKKASIAKHLQPQELPPASTAAASDFDFPGTGGGGGGYLGEENADFFGLRWKDAHCNPYIIRLLHQDFDLYGQRTSSSISSSASMEAALSAIDLPSSMQETLENLDLLNDIDKPILLPNGNIYQKTINNKNHRLFSSSQQQQQKIQINSAIQNTLLKTVSPNRAVKEEKLAEKTEKLLAGSYKGLSTPQKMKTAANTSTNTPSANKRASSSNTTTHTTPGKSSILPASQDKKLMKKMQNANEMLSMSLSVQSPLAMTSSDPLDSPTTLMMKNMTLTGGNTTITGPASTISDKELAKELEASRKNRSRQINVFEKEMKKYKSVSAWK